jgi:hypothetical protein
MNPDRIPDSLGAVIFIGIMLAVMALSALIGEPEFME